MASASGFLETSISLVPSGGQVQGRVVETNLAFVVKLADISRTNGWDIDP
jgi:hypothetical protein